MKMILSEDAVLKYRHGMGSDSCTLRHADGLPILAVSAGNDADLFVSSRYYKSLVFGCRLHCGHLGRYHVFALLDPCLQM